MGSLCESVSPEEGPYVDNSRQTPEHSQQHVSRIDIECQSQKTASNYNVINYASSRDENLSEIQLKSDSDFNFKIVPGIPEKQEFRISDLESEKNLNSNGFLDKVEPNKSQGRQSTELQLNVSEEVRKETKEFEQIKRKLEIAELCLTESDQQLVTKKQEMVDMQVQMEEVMDKLGQSTTRVDLLQNQSQTQSDLIKQLQEKLIYEKQQYIEAQQKLQSLKEQQKNQESKDVQALNKKYEAQVEKATVTQHHAEMTQIEKKLKIDECNKLQQEIEDLKQRVTETEQELEKQTTKINDQKLNHDQELVELKASNTATLEEQRKEFERKAEAQKFIYNNLLQDKEQLQVETTKLQKEFYRLKVDHDERTELLGKSRMEVDELTQKRNENSVQHAKQMYQRTEVHKLEKEELKKKSHEYQTRLTWIQRQKDSIEDEFFCLNQQLIDAHEENRKFKQLRDTEKHMDKKEMQVKQDLILRLQMKLQDLKTEITQLQRQQKEEQQNKEDLIRTVKTLQNLNNSAPIIDNKTIQTPYVVSPQSEVGSEIHGSANSEKTGMQVEDSIRSVSDFSLNKNGANEQGVGRSPENTSGTDTSDAEYAQIPNNLDQATGSVTLKKKDK